MADNAAETVIDEEVKGDEKETVEGEVLNAEQSKSTVGGAVQGNEIVEDEHGQGEQTEGEHVESEHIEGEHVEGEQTEGELEGGEQTEGEHTELDEEKIRYEGEEIPGEGAEEHIAAEETDKKEEVYDEMVEEEQYVEEPPPDPSAPYDFSDSKEFLKPPFELRPDQLAEVEQLWDLYQDYTPAYTDLDGYITEKELIYMLKSLVLMTYTPEQLQELIAFCVRPPHPQGHITYEQFLKMVTIRQRDMSVDMELRFALQILDPGKTGTIDREYFTEVVGKMGYKLTPKLLDALVKEVDISNDGTLGIDDVLGTMCIDLNQEDIIMLRQSVFPPDNQADDENIDD